MENKVWEKNEKWKKKLDIHVTFFVTIEDLASCDLNEICCDAAEKKYK